ncbi:MAG: ABC transporter permease [Candidatus Thermoplasmatota archaeon]|nr:ABC transporter permease [Candidatus Thermoplasmatota archaeon]
MKLPLFKAAFKDQQTSMWVYVGVMLFYGLLIMVAFLSVEDMLSEPFSSVEGITLTKIGTNDEYDVFNLKWETRTGTAAHVAFGLDLDEGMDWANFTLDDIEGFNMSQVQDLFEDHFGNISLGEYLKDDPMLMEFFENYTGDHSGNMHYPAPIPFPDGKSGIELVYFGEGTYVNFTNSGSSLLFVVGLIPNDWNLSNITFLGPVSSMDLMQISDFDEYLEENPMMKAFFGEEMISFTEIEGFIALEYFSMWPLMLLIFLAIKTGGTVSKHVDDQSIDILLATGYSRFRFLNEKMLVVAMNLALVVIAAWVGVILGVFMIGKPVPVAGITIAFLGSVPLAFGMVGLSLLLSVLIDESSKTTGAIMGLTIFMFMIQIVSNIAGWQDGLGYISLFTYYDMNQLMVHRTFDAVNIILPSVIGMVSMIASYILFKKKEIHA